MLFIYLFWVYWVLEALHKLTLVAMTWAALQLR